MWLQLWEDYVNDGDQAHDAERLHYISSSTRRQALSSFLEDLESKPDVIRDLIENWDDAPAAIHDRFIKHASDAHSPAIQQYRILKQLADMRLPHQWFPQARSMKVRGYHSLIGVH